MQSFFEEIRSKRKYFPLQRIFSFPLTEMVDKASLYFISEAVEWPFLLWYVTFTSGLCSAIPPEDAGAHLRSPCVLRGVAKDISVVSQTFFFLSLLYLWKDSSGVFFFSLSLHSLKVRWKRNSEGERGMFLWEDVTTVMFENRRTERKRKTGMKVKDGWWGSRCTDDGE